MIIGVDFDGTVVSHEYPRIGEPAPLAIEVLTELSNAGHDLVLWTMRSGEFLDEAVEHLRENGISLWGINSNPDQHRWTDSPKAYCQLYIDDAALGCPLKWHVGSSRWIVDWLSVRQRLRDRGVLPK